MRIHCILVSGGWQGCLPGTLRWPQIKPFRQGILKLGGALEALSCGTQLNSNGHLADSRQIGRCFAGEGLEGLFLCFLAITLWEGPLVGRIGFPRPGCRWLRTDCLAGPELAGRSCCEIPASWPGCAAISTSQTFQSDFSCFLKASALSCKGWGLEPRIEISWTDTHMGVSLPEGKYELSIFVKFMQLDSHPCRVNLFHPVFQSVWGLVEFNSLILGRNCSM